MMVIGKQIKKGDFILYREKSSTSAQLTPARMQSNLNAVFAICDVTDIQNAVPQPRIVCGVVKWVQLRMLWIAPIREEALLTAPTVEGVKQ